MSFFANPPSVSGATSPFACTSTLNSFLGAVVPSPPCSHSSRENVYASSPFSSEIELTSASHSLSLSTPHLTTLAHTRWPSQAGLRIAFSHCVFRCLTHGSCPIQDVKGTVAMFSTNSPRYFLPRAPSHRKNCPQHFCESSNRDNLLPSPRSS